MVIYELSAQRADQEHKSSRQLNPFFFSLLSLPGGRSHRGLLFSQLFRSPLRTANACRKRTLYWEGMSDAIESKANNNGHDETALIGRESNVVPGRFGEPLQITHVQYSRGGGNTAPKRPLFLCLHGWGSNETDLADMMRYVAPYNDFASLRAPLTLQPTGRFAPGAYSWLHDCVDTGEDLDRDAFAAAKAIDDWVSANIPDDRAVVPIGFSQGGLLAIHLLRVHPERYAATISLSGFLAPGTVAGTAPADDRVAELNIPTFFGYDKNDTVIPMPELFATAAWLDEHTFLTEKSYRGLDHSVSMEEFSDLRDWLAAHNIAPGIL